MCSPQGARPIRARIWAFVQSKGGSGKSTLATNIAVQAEAAGKPVLLVDLDTQSSAALWGNLRGDKRPTVFEGRPDKLAQIVASAPNLGAEQIIIDTPSKTDAVTLAAIRVADLIICPVKIDLFSLGGLQDTARLIEMTGKLGATVAVLNDLDESGVVANVGAAEAVLKSIGMPLAPTQIYHRPAYTQAIAKGLSVTELGAKQQAAADEIRELWAFLDAGAPQPKPPPPRSKATKAKKPGKKGAKP
jgi:chromosome partitioning protein